jgi:hypothetical protein
MKNLFEYLLAMKIATSYNSMDTSITCYATSEAILFLLRGLNYNDDGYIYHTELINSCTWLVTRN